MAFKFLATSLAFSLAASESTIFDKELDNQTLLYSPPGISADVSLTDRCKDRVCVIVNVASEWKLTAVNYKQLNALLEKYEDLTVIAQPCNQFGSQEPLEGKKLYDHIMKSFKPVGDWVLLKRADVNGKNETKLYHFLKNHPNCKSWVLPNKVLWNFEKFIVGRDGVPLVRYRSKSNPLTMEEDIKRALDMDRSKIDTL